MTETTNTAAVDSFLARLARADRAEWDRASHALESDLPAWEAAVARARQAVRELGLADDSERLRLQAKVIGRKHAAGSSRSERSRRAIWAAQGSVLGLLAGKGLRDVDIRCLCDPFAELIPGMAVNGVRLQASPPPRQSTSGGTTTDGYCPIHGVPLTYGGCHVCRSQHNHSLNKFGGKR